MIHINYHTATDCIRGSSLEETWSPIAVSGFVPGRRKSSHRAQRSHLRAWSVVSGSARKFYISQGGEQGLFRPVRPGKPVRDPFPLFFSRPGTPGTPGDFGFVAGDLWLDETSPGSSPLAIGPAAVISTLQRPGCGSTPAGRHSWSSSPSRSSRLSSIGWRGLRQSGHVFLTLAQEQSKGSGGTEYA